MTSDNRQPPAMWRQYLASPFFALTAFFYSRHWKRAQFVSVVITQTLLGIPRIHHLDQIGG